jgi:hypothetical protein
MVRGPSPQTIEAFYTVLERAFAMHRDKVFATDLAMLLATRVVAQEDAGIWGDGVLDPSIPAFVLHASTWTGRLKIPFTIVHDQSKPLVDRRVLLEAMMSTTEQPTQIGYDRRQMAFPILADGIDFRDSEDMPQLQVADLLAGSTGYCLRTAAQGVTDSFATKLLTTRALAGHFLPVWPERKVTPDELGTAQVGGIDAASFMGDYISRRLAGILPLRSGGSANGGLPSRVDKTG